MNALIPCRRRLLVVLLATLLAGCGEGRHAADGTGHLHGAQDAVAPERGPHGGRLLRDGSFGVELAIVEDGVAPEYHAWITEDGQPAPAATLAVELERLDGERQRFDFAAQGDHLRGDGVVAEPHSFTVRVRATHAGRTHEWQYDSFEGRTTLSAPRAQAAGVRVAAAGPRRIREVVPLYGRIVSDPEAVRDVAARFPGIVRSVERSIGETVKAGAVLARVESNDSLQVYSLTAPIAGTLTARRVQPGEHTGSGALFTITDLSRVLVELTVFPRDRARLQAGQELLVRAVDDDRQARARLLRIAPAGDQAGQALHAWARLEAAGDTWTPGLYVQAELLAGGVEVPLAVPRSALQTFRDFVVVFVRVGDIYEVRMPELGRSDREYVEVLGGLKPGAEVVVENSYLIKADIEKSGASHDH